MTLSVWSSTPKYAFAIITMAIVLTGCGDSPKKDAASAEAPKAKVEVPTFGNTTEIPVNITTPDIVETSIGTLNFFDGVPTKETADITQDFLLKARGVDAFLKGIPGASLQELRRGPADLGVNEVGKVAIFDYQYQSS